MFGFEFWHTDRHERQERCLLTDFLKKISLGKTGHFGPKNGALS